jgi:hypothetical protein
MFEEKEVSWSTSPALRVATVVILCSAGAALGTAANTHRWDAAAAVGGFVAVTGTISIPLVLGIRRFIRLAATSEVKPPR